MNSLISIVIGINIMIAPTPAIETKEVETAIHPAKSMNEIIQDQHPWQQDLLTSEILIPRMGKEYIEINAAPKSHVPISSIIHTPIICDSVEVESHSIIGDGFETFPCYDYPGCMIVSWEQSDGHITTMCCLHKIRHRRE